MTDDSNAPNIKMSDLLSNSSSEHKFIDLHDKEFVNKAKK